MLGDQSSSHTLADFETLSCELDGSVATVAFNRPDALNAISPLMEREFLEGFDVVDRSDEVPGGGRPFCAGPYLPEGGAVLDGARRPRERGTEPIADGDVPRDGGGMMAL